ncbi:MAG: hypothetical protein ACXVCY_05330 [Pseudobdellovibrionaceae bacterium]
MKIWGLTSMIIAIVFLKSICFAHGSYLFETTFENIGADYIVRLNQQPTDILSELPASAQVSCIQRYKNILADGIIDIRVAIGYFDWTAGKNVTWRGGDYGLSPSIDIGAFYALKKLLLSRCRGNSQFCSFKQNPRNENNFYKTVQLHGKKYVASIQMHFSSATEFLNNNLRSYHAEQQQRTFFMESFFRDALKKADAVFYFGHSRNGGGPDFSPPVFINGQNKVNYSGYYEVLQPGFKKLISALNDSPRTSVLGLMSCDSRDHFLKKIRSTAPNIGVITSTDVVNVDQVYTALIGGIDSLLRGQCQKNFYESLRLTTKNKEYITMDGMFE